MAKKIKLNFQYEKSTPGAHRFQELNDKGDVVTTNEGACIGILYLRKSAIGNDAPSKLTVTVEAS